jgi:hypothetical protein
MADNPMFAGYSIGRWTDSKGTGRYDTLLVETRGLKSPRVYEASGIPFHEDGQTITPSRHPCRQPFRTTRAPCRSPAPRQ